MKIKLFLSIILLSVVLLNSCTDDVQVVESKNQQETLQRQGFVKASVKNVTWTAYKTSEKIPVTGTFEESCIISQNKARTLIEAIDGSHFSIPVSSVFTSNQLRDFRIENFFFKILEDTDALSGDIFISDATTGYVNLKMNNIIERLPFTYTLKNGSFKLHTVMDLKDWNAQGAKIFLRDKTREEHMGIDKKSSIDDEVCVDVEISADDDDGSGENDGC